MGNEKKEKKEKVSKIGGWLQKIFSFFLRWFFLAAIIATSLYAVYIWKKYILNADWSEEKKKAYISEQSVLSFDEDKYKKALEIIDIRREKLENSEKFSGRDIFFPE
ncbi:MAG: hypothetical protein A2359_04465 [Candidatus Moranbacteria bacterium RIFOXYB1_FULL_43_19]|nr:MAG: hypothetical protein A2359_04465 [Candidatus Moranbacteria bacterium RIFOXYB1_FULL_43_19]OGI28783.1 MAG: hypothetical protein A2184_01955 [Candidatus Moranbacteria bacterium RIFOXYA1_FULL_44_7]OGI33131.1 MAG: hypothetical protein A2420_05705 [Candidatus Moranbacteria bacterium RIFOXYC1_FULL_44_13]OGI38666.1 MAG: hypothetical protein A2612_00400 [Candidatus Moranbacteria bacterium RIFOXYD1_FULL_44_12]